MKTTQTLLWLMGGAAIGAAVMYIATREESEELLTNLKDVTRHTRDNLTDRFRKLTGKEKATAEQEMGFDYRKGNIGRGYDLDGTMTQ
jgi:KaiC/GvpD/RAD55 family RecA-like ATPase